MRSKGRADLFNMRPMTADGFMQLVTRNAEFFRPVGDIRGHFGVNLFGIVRTPGVIYVQGVGLMGFGCVVML